jgi:prolyl-tRNA editing enzyme YbaK/EbsC (Cys-tRNA(Pro) deacylase)
VPTPPCSRPRPRRGFAEPIRTLVDTWLARHQQVWAAAGHPHTVFSTTYDELLDLTGGRAVDVER